MAATTKVSEACDTLIDYVIDSDDFAPLERQMILDNLNGLKVHIEEH